MEPYSIIISVFLIVVALENFFPRKKLTTDFRWYLVAIIYNLFQLFILFIGPYTWEKLVGGPGLFKLPYSPFVNGLIVYLINSWIFYWWHYLRHANNFLWLYFHQVHHISNNINSFEAFIKHPFELIANAIIMTVLTGPILGLDKQTNDWLTVISACTEFFYHMNVATPRWIGWFIQRPESHDFHHELDVQTSAHNYGDLFIWDWLGATDKNPMINETTETGFTGDAGTNALSIDALIGRNLIKHRKKPLPENYIRNALITGLAILGALHMIGYIYRSPNIMGLAFMSSSSPLPLVFSSYNGYETFSTKFEIKIYYVDNKTETIIPTNLHYNAMSIPYNMKNMLGAAFSHGPFFENKHLIDIRDQILVWGLCKGKVAQKFEITDPVARAEIIVTSKRPDLTRKQWIMNIVC
jgi:sterol desaturase/sphingolipid hydroxylase (fatty acid hydroxylase superfamily)